MARSLSALASLAGSLLLVFVLLWMAPGDPALLALRSGSRPARLDPASLEAFRAHFGLDRPAASQFLLWTRRAFTLDFGRSIQSGQEVRERLAESLPITAALNGLSLILAFLGAITAAAFAAGRRLALERFLSGIMDTLFATPPFVSGLLLIFVFSISLGWTPVLAGLDTSLRDLLLPAVTLALATAPPLYRFFLELFRDARASPLTLAARARGEERWALLRRSLKRSGPAVAALLAALVPSCLAGSVLVEKLFSVGGAGSLLADAVAGRDYPVVLAMTFLTAGAVVLAGLLADGVTAFLDPRRGTEEE